MSEQRIQTVKIVWKSDDAKGKVVEFTRSVKGADDAVEQLNKMMGDAATVTSHVAKNQKELTAEKRREATANIRAYNQYNKLTSQLKQQITVTSLSAEEQEVYNAQMRLGANATEEQRLEIAKLVTQLQEQRGAQAKTQGSMRGLRGQAQNLGWQMQDVAVQMQMGTDALVIFSQQGSQLASGFGPGGAVVGALIAVGGALAGVIWKMATGEKTAKELKKAQEDLNKVFQEGENDAEGLTAAYEKLFAKNKALAILQAQRAQFLAESQLKKTKKDLLKLTREELVVEQTWGKAKVSSAIAISRHAKELKISTDQYRKLIALRNKGDIKALAGELTSLSKNGKSEELTKLAMQFVEADYKAANLTERIKTLKGIVSGKVTPDDPSGGKGKSDPAKAFEAEYNRLIKQTETTKEQYERRKAIVDAFNAETVADKAKQVQALDLLEKWKTKTEGEEEEKRIALREKALKYVERQMNRGAGSDPMVAEGRVHDRNMEILQDQLLKLKENELDEKKRINDLLEQEEKRHEQAIADIEQQQLNTKAANIQQGLAIMTSTVNLLANGTEQVQQQTAEMNEAQKVMFLMNQGVAAAMAVVNGMSLGMELAKNFGGLDGTTAAASGYATFGTALGAAQAGAIMGTTFAGMFDKGGTIPAGQMGIVSEYGDELVNGTLVKGPANVTSREDTAKMMGGAKVNVNVINNAVGTVRAEVQQVSETDIKVMITEHFNDNIDRGVATSISKRGSKTDKAMKSNYSTSRRY